MDSTGARVASAQVLVEAVASSLQREAKTEDRGEFRIDDLPPGNYHLTVTAAGFAKAQADVSVVLSSVREVTVTLRPVAASETLSVRSQSSSITTQPIDLASVVHQGIMSASI